MKKTNVMGWLPLLVLAALSGSAAAQEVVPADQAPYLKSAQEVFGAAAERLREAEKTPSAPAAHGAPVKAKVTRTEEGALLIVEISKPGATPRTLIVVGSPADKSFVIDLLDASLPGAMKDKRSGADPAPVVKTLDEYVADVMRADTSTSTLERRVRALEVYNHTKDDLKGHLAVIYRFE